MAKLVIRTQQAFRDAMLAIPLAREHLEPADAHGLLTDVGTPTAEYGLWHELLDVVRIALDADDRAALGPLLAIYDAVERAGPRGVMYESSYVAFLEDVPLPTEPARLRDFWRVAPPKLVEDLKHCRGLR